MQAGSLQAKPPGWADPEDGIVAKVSEALRAEFKEVRKLIRLDLKEELRDALAQAGAFNPNKLIAPKAALSRAGTTPSFVQITKPEESLPKTPIKIIEKVKFTEPTLDSAVSSVSMRPLSCSPTPPANDIEVLRVSAKPDGRDTVQSFGSVDGWVSDSAAIGVGAFGLGWQRSGSNIGGQSLNLLQIPGKGRQTQHRKVGFSIRPAGNRASHHDARHTKQTDFLQQSILAAVTRASARQKQPEKTLTKGMQDIVHGQRKSMAALVRRGTEDISNVGDAKPDDRLSWEETFELFAACAIVVNGAFFGVQTEVMANKRTEDSPLFFFFAEILFFLIFGTELVLRLVKERCRFFQGGNKFWNCFDSFLVLLQAFDIAMEATKSVMQGGAGVQLSFLRMLRILRILRALRLLRLVKFFGELNVVTSAIANSVKSLCGTMMMLLLFIYIFAIAFTGAANSYLVALRDSGTEIDGTPVEVWFSNLGRTVLSLYEAIMGGNDWDNLMEGLLQIHIGWAMLFLFYISFMTLTMLNVITGIFVDSAVKHAAQEQEKTFAQQMRRFFSETVDKDVNGTITRVQFETEMEKPEFAKLMQEVGIEPREARLLFDLLDMDRSNDIEADEFLAGMVRLRAGARFIDIMNVQSAMISALVHNDDRAVDSQWLGTEYGGEDGDKAGGSMDFTELDDEDVTTFEPGT